MHQLVLGLGGRYAWGTPAANRIPTSFEYPTLSLSMRKFTISRRRQYILQEAKKDNRETDLPRFAQRVSGKRRQEKTGSADWRYAGGAVAVEKREQNSNPPTPVPVVERPRNPPAHSLRRFRHAEAACRLSGSQARHGPVPHRLNA